MADQAKRAPGHRAPDLGLRRQHRHRWAWLARQEGRFAVDFWHSATFSWDGKVVNFIDESFGSGCPPVTRFANGTLNDTGRMFVSDFAAGRPNPQPRPITLNEARPTWPGPGAHSAIKLFRRDWVYVSDEVYGTATAPDHGCPWGWARMIDISDPQRPIVRGEYRLPENDPSTCDEFNPPRTSYSAHNPTQTKRIVFTTWHSGGLQAISVRPPRRPSQLAEFFPEPLDEVLLEDPRLSSDPDTGRNEKVVMWSYPIIKDGLIYVVDLRNGLYVLDYKGKFSREVSRIDFLEGNSNQGDALCFERVAGAPRRCD